MDDAVIALERHDKELDNLKEENQLLHAKLKDLENRSRRSNHRICGIPETILDLQVTITALLQEHITFIPVKCLDFDHIHPALTRRTQDGPPRDIMIKFLYYHTIQQAARSQESLAFQGHAYQAFAHLATHYNCQKMSNEASFTDYSSPSHPVQVEISIPSPVYLLQPLIPRHYSSRGPTSSG